MKKGVYGLFKLLNISYKKKWKIICKQINHKPLAYYI